jgi:nucleotide-binding universal stress UspA family protein
MTTTITEPGDSIREGSVVVAADGSFHAHRAVEWAAREARVQGLPLAVVYVEHLLGTQERGWVATAGIPLQQITDEMRTDSEALLEHAYGLAVEAAPDIDVEAVLHVGDARQVLLELAPRARMLVLGSRGRGPVSSLLLGSVSIAVSRRAACPVVVVRPWDDQTRRTGVLVGVNGSPRSIPTVEAAFLEASYHQQPLTVVHCLWDAFVAPEGWTTVGPDEEAYESAQARVAELLGGLREKFPEVTVDAQITKGHVDRCIADLSRSHELTVVGRHAHTLLERVGSMSLTTSIVENSRGPVLVVP